MRTTEIDEQTARAALASTPGVNLRLFNRLMRRFGSAAEVLRAASADLLYTDGVSNILAPRIAGRLRSARAISARAAYLQSTGFQLITGADHAYPDALRDLSDAPAMLAARGRLHFPDRSVAVVGQRNPSKRGREAARFAAETARNLGWCVVSGLALGVDTEAHRTALRIGANASPEPATIAVLPSEPISIYPPRRRLLAEKIAEKGLLVSEHLWGELQRWMFVQRNRIISGLCRGALIIEAGERDGALHTARFAAKQGRSVAVWDWSSAPNRSLGTAALERSGISAYHKKTLHRWFSRLEQGGPYSEMALFEKTLAFDIQLR
ncbi:MAG: DNA-processing protein DprA [Candidatus Poribacteria bacterium]|nr:DNA-processing protein DprA [Candidatus Poribacteria bacterium]